MQFPLTSSRALWITLGVCAIAAILAPLFVSAPETPPVSNPTVAEIIAESASLDPWFTLYDEATALRATLERPKPGSDNDQLELFLAKTSAQSAFRDWARKQRAPTVEAVKQDARGSGLLRNYRAALIKSHRALEKQRTIAEAKKDVVDVIQQIRAGIVTKNTDSNAIDTVSSQFATLRASVTDGSADVPSIEETVDAEINRELQQIRESPS